MAPHLGARHTKKEEVKAESERFWRGGNGGKGPSLAGLGGDEVEVEAEAEGFLVVDGLGRCLVSSPLRDLRLQASALAV